MKTLDAKLYDLRELYRRREDWRLQEQSTLGRILAIVRQVTGCPKSHAPFILTSVFGKSETTYSVASKQFEIPSAIFEALVSRGLEFHDAMLIPVRKRRKNYETEMERLVATIPAFGWIESIRGVAALSYALILAESMTVEGDEIRCLENYPNPAKLWKRFGLGLVGGEIQRRVRDTEKGTKHGYSPKRRAILWNVGECLIKLNDGKYRAAYDVRKMYETQRAQREGLEIRPAGKIKKGDAAISPLRIHRRSARYASKLFLKDLWHVWRNALAEEGERLAS